MRIHFYLRYRTQFGESIAIQFKDGAEQPLEYLNEDFWHGSFEFDPAKTPQLGWFYRFRDRNGRSTDDWENERHLDVSAHKSEVATVMDTWNPANALENAFMTQPFQNIFYKTDDVAAKSKNTGAFTHVFKIKAPGLKAHEAVCLLGHGTALRAWDTAAPIVLKKEGGWWTARLDLSKEDFPLAYKYGVWNTKENRLSRFEDGSNRPLFASPEDGDMILHDGFIRLPVARWRGAGVAIPVFSLRSDKSFGIGEFTDLPLLVDWAKSVGLKVIQLLPINDTTATHTWTDSYPYAAISAFALHPVFINVAQLAGKKHAALLKPYAKQQKALNALAAVDYEAVLQAKWDILRQLYDLMKADWQKDKDWLAYYATNQHWLAPYAAFCYLRDVNGTPDFGLWTSHQQYDPAAVAKMTDPASKTYDQVALHLFVQYQLHLQLKAAADYAHANGLALKGDIPIGIYRYSCDAWVAPELYNMDKQAGAPPDDFAEKGQNWGFPTYNWARMQEDGFAWWRQRFEQMSLYFDAFRIDHILGFFRIWSIPLGAVEGILGQFVPAIPITEQELRERGIGFSHERLCQPFIDEQLLLELFGIDAAFIAEQFLVPVKNTRPGNTQFLPKTEFDTQRKVEHWYNAQAPDERNTRLRDGLYNLLTNVILLDDPEIAEKGAAAGSWRGAFRFGIDKTVSFQRLDADVRQRLNDLYVQYFYRRQDAFWQTEAMAKLPALKRSTNMLICGEDLGMVPHCVPDVMDELGILSLEIQRMPKKTGSAFFHPKDAPYLSVVTPSTHDMSTLRGWWEEDRELTQRFYNELLQQPGTAPWFCEPWINRMLLEQHFHSPAMWSIFQLQDLMGMDGALRRENPNEERINVPANPKHYWQYRMHVSLEQLLQAAEFNGALQRMVLESGRG